MIDTILRTAFPINRAFALLSFAAVSAASAAEGRVVMKLADGAGAIRSVNAYSDWVNGGSINEGVPGASDVANDTIDFKDDFVDSNWSLVSKVRVSMYIDGAEQAFIEFNADGTTKNDFYSIDNLIAASWASLSVDQFNYFSIEGASSAASGSLSHLERYWYANRNWGGCSNDRGYLQVIEGATGFCSWERSPQGIADRMFQFTTDDGGTIAPLWFQNVQVADVFAVSVTLVPEPTSVGLAALPLLFALTHRRAPCPNARRMGMRARLTPTATIDTSCDSHAYLLRM